MTRALSRFLQAKRGAALVEFTLVAPLLVMLMCGLAEFANAMRQYHIMEKGVRDAGRYLARAAMSGCTVEFLPCGCVRAPPTSCCWRAATGGERPQSRLGC